MNNSMFPDWLDLITLWASVHCKDVPCAIFSVTPETAPAVMTFFTEKEKALTVCADYAILRCPTIEVASHLVRTYTKSFAISWNGTSFSADNSDLLTLRPPPKHEEKPARTGARTRRIAPAKR